MRFHWYWPFVREEELAMATAVLCDGDEVVIEAIDRDASPTARSSNGLTVVRDLPDIRRDVSRLGWASSRANTYVKRSRVRRRHWSSSQYDLFHIHYLNRFTDSVARLPRPMVMSVHDAVPHIPRLGHGLDRRLLSRVYARPDALIVHHVSVAETLTELFGLSRDRIHVVPYPVLTMNTEESLPPVDPPMVLLFGSLRPNKGLETLDEVMHLVQGVDIRLVIAGRGHSELEQRSRQMAQRDSRISAEIGFVSSERKAELFRDASVVVLPYTSFSSQSAVLHDAYGYGRPVVVTDVGALGDTVRDDGTGLVVPTNDPAALASALGSLLEPSAWGQAASACCTVATQRSPQEFGRQLRSVYAELLA